jgi:hypothetical protein
MGMVETGKRTSRRMFCRRRVVTGRLAWLDFFHITQTWSTASADETFIVIVIIEMAMRRSP